jgi:hypothetical protein
MILLRVVTALGGASAITSGEMLLVGALNTRASTPPRRARRSTAAAVVRYVPRDRRRRDPRPGPRIGPGHEPNARRLAIAPDAAILGLMPWVMGTSGLRLAAASGSARHPLRWSSVGHSCAISDRSIAGAVAWDGEEDVPPRAVIRPTRRNVGRRVYRFIRRPRYEREWMLLSREAAPASRHVRDAGILRRPARSRVSAGDATSRSRPRKPKRA